MGRDARGADRNDVPLADETVGYVDVFNDSNINRFPELLADGSSIAWPAYFTEEDARKWRALMGLEWPGLKQARREFVSHQNAPSENQRVHKSASS